MGQIKEISIKNRTYYFFNDTINIEEFDTELLKIDKKWYKDIDIYYIVYIAINLVILKIIFNADDNLSLNKSLKLHLFTIIVRCIFEEDSKFYLQLYLDECLYKL